MVQIQNFKQFIAVLLIFIVEGSHLGTDPDLTHFHGSDFGRLYFYYSLCPLRQNTVDRAFARISLGSDGIGQ